MTRYIVKDCVSIYKYGFDHWFYGESEIEIDRQTKLLLLADNTLAIQVDTFSLEDNNITKSLPALYKLINQMLKDGVIEEIEVAE